MFGAGFVVCLVLFAHSLFSYWYLLVTFVGVLLDHWIMKRFLGNMFLVSSVFDDLS